MSRMIDADKLKKDVLDLKDCYNGFSDTYDKACIIGVIDEQPAMEERKRGKWIDTTQGDHYKCSCCGTRAAFWFNEENSSGWERDMSEWLSDYCPNCGADMRDLHDRLQDAIDDGEITEAEAVRKMDELAVGYAKYLKEKSKGE